MYRLHAANIISLERILCFPPCFCEKIGVIPFSWSIFYFLQSLSSFDIPYLGHRMLHSSGVAGRLRGAQADVLSNSRLIAGSSGRSRVGKDQRSGEVGRRKRRAKKKDTNARGCYNDGKKLLRHAATTIWVLNEARVEFNFFSFCIQWYYLFALLPRFFQNFAARIIMIILLY